MRFSQVTAAMMMASLSAPLLAASEHAVGTLTAASQGTFVARGGRLVAGYPGQLLYAGDRVVTRGKASARVSMSGCSYRLGSTSILSVGNGACTAAPKSLAVQDDATTPGEVAAVGTEDTSAAGLFVAGAAAAAIGLGVYVAADQNDSSPASP